METPAHGHLIHILTKYYFGEIVAQTIRHLFKYDHASLRFLKATAPDIKSNDLKKSLLILVKFQLVDYVKTIKNLGQNFEYSLVSERVIVFYRIPHFINELSTHEDDSTVFALKLLAESGMMSKSRLSQKLSEFFNKSQGSGGKLENADAVIGSLIIRKYLVEMSDNICINIERLNRYHRDQEITKTVGRFYSGESKIQSICNAIMELSLENTSDEALFSAPVPLESLRNILCPKHLASANELETIMNRLTSEFNYKFFVKSGTHPHKGPMFAVNIGLVIDHLMKEHLCSMVTSKFGPRCCRVFRVLLQRGPLLLKQVEEFIMLPTKDVREYSYMLIKAGLVRNRQVPKTLDNAPGKSVFIMSIDMDQVVFKMADLCCKTICNLLIRHEFELNCNESLLKKHKAVQELLLKNSCDEPAVEEDYFSNHELSQLKKTLNNLDRLLLAKSQVDDTLFLTHVWLKLRPNISA